MIVPVASGIELTVDGESRRTIDWDRVAQVVAYKRDRYRTDLVCIGFVMQGDRDRIWEIHEELEGYDLIQDSLNRLTRGAWPERLSDVAFPAFETSFTVVWTAEGELGAIDDPRFVQAWQAHSPETD